MLIVNFAFKFTTTQTGYSDFKPEFALYLSIKNFQSFFWTYKGESSRSNKKKAKKKHERK